MPWFYLSGLGFIFKWITMNEFSRKPTNVDAYLLKSKQRQIFLLPQRPQLFDKSSLCWNINVNRNLLLILPQCLNHLSSYCIPLREKPWRDCLRVTLPWILFLWPSLCVSAKSLASSAVLSIMFCVLLVVISVSCSLPRVFTIGG